VRIASFQYILWRGAVFTMRLQRNPWGYGENEVERELAERNLIHMARRETRFMDRRLCAVNDCMLKVFYLRM